MFLYIFIYGQAYEFNFNIRMIYLGYRSNFLMKEEVLLLLISHLWLDEMLQSCGLRTFLLRVA